MSTPLLFKNILIFIAFLISSFAIGKLILNPFKSLNSKYLNITSFLIGASFFSYLFYCQRLTKTINKTLFVILILITIPYGLKEFKNIFKGCFSYFRHSLFYLYVTLFFIIVTLLIFFVATSELSGIDACLYHLGVSKYFIKFKTPYSPSFNPMGAMPRLINGMYSVLYLISDVIPCKWLNALFLILNAITIWIFLNSYTQKFAPLASITFLVLPYSIGLASHLFIDSGMTLFLLLSFFYILDYYQYNKKSFLILSSILYGLSLSSKYLSLFFLPMYITVLFKKKNSYYQIIPFLIIAILIASPFYIKNIVVYKNPFYPYFQSLFNQTKMRDCYFNIKYYKRPFLSIIQGFLPRRLCWYIMILIFFIFYFFFPPEFPFKLILSSLFFTHVFIVTSIKIFSLHNMILNPRYGMLFILLIITLLFLLINSLLKKIKMMFPFHYFLLFFLFIYSIFQTGSGYRYHIVKAYTANKIGFKPYLKKFFPEIQTLIYVNKNKPANFTSIPLFLRYLFYLEEKYDTVSYDFTEPELEKLFRKYLKTGIWLIIPIELKYFVTENKIFKTTAPNPIQKKIQHRKIKLYKIVKKLLKKLHSTHKIKLVYKNKKFVIYSIAPLPEY